jgi:hypothetical protein
MLLPMMLGTSLASMFRRTEQCTQCNGQRRGPFITLKFKPIDSANVFFYMFNEHIFVMIKWCMIIIERLPYPKVSFIIK